MAAPPATLARTLTFSDLLGAGIASIMGSGGFNLLGDAIVAGGSSFVVPLAGISALFQGASKVYQEAYETYKSNTAESDLVRDQLGSVAATTSQLSILLFNTVGISIILVICTKFLLPDGSWLTQVGTALAILAGISAFSLQGIELNAKAILGFGAATAALLLVVTGVGIGEAATGGLPTTLPKALTNAKPDYVKSILYFYFILAGFDALIKFTQEAKDPDADVPRSFYVSNALSTLLAVGVAFAFLVVFSGRGLRANENIIATILHEIHGGPSRLVVNYISILLMLGTIFVFFLATTRYLYGLADDVPAAAPLKELNAAAAPVKAIGLTAAVAAAGVLVNNTYKLVRVSDFGLTVTLGLVSAAATRRIWSAGKFPLVEGATTLGFLGLLSVCCF